MKNKKEFFSLLVIIFIALFLRFNHLVTIPNGFNQDESAIGYNAYSILETGKDEYGQSFPLYFKSFGDHKLPAYIYVTALSEKFFGINEFAVRFPSAFLGSLTVFMIFFMIKLLTGNTKLSLLTAFLLAINPWHLFFSRAAFEVNAGLSFAIAGVLLFLLAMQSKKSVYLYFSMFVFAASLYAYNVTRLLAPALVIMLIFLYWPVVKKFSKITLLSVGVFFVILLLPFIVTFFSPSGLSSAQGALITSADIQAKSLEMRSYVAEPAPLIGKIFFNKYVYIVWQYMQNIIGSLSFNFFYISGSPHGSQGIGNMGQFYLIEFPLLLLGLFSVINRKIKHLSLFVVWMVTVFLVLSLSKEVPHATRGYFLVIPMIVFSAVGLLFLIEKIQKITKRHIQIAVFGCMLILALYNIVYYFTSYYLRFPTAYAKGWRQQDKALSAYIKENEKKYDKIIFDSNAGFMYTSLLFFNSYPPKEFQRTVKRFPDDTEGFSYISSFGKYEWKEIDWDKDIKEHKTLLVTSPNKAPSNQAVLSTFSYPQVPIVLSTKERILQFPTQEAAYILIESK